MANKKLRKVDDGFEIKVDGKSCKIKMKETENGIKMETMGVGCKRVMGKDYFKKMEMKFPKEDW